MKTVKQIAGCAIVIIGLAANIGCEVPTPENTPEIRVIIDTTFRASIDSLEHVVNNQCSIYQHVALQGWVDSIVAKQMIEKSKYQQSQ